MRYAMRQIRGRSRRFYANDPNGANSFWLSHGEEEYPVINLSVNGDLAYLHYLSNEGHPGFSSLGSLESLQPGGVSTFFLVGPIAPDEIWNYHVVSVDDALKALSPAFKRLYSEFGRPSIPPEKLLRALLLQVLFTVRSERLLMEALNYNLLFRWFVGLNMDEAVWVPTVFSKNRDRLLEGDIAERFFAQVLSQAREARLL